MSNNRYIAAYPKINREPDFTIQRRPGERDSIVDYWIGEVSNLDNFTIYYGYRNGRFDNYLGLVESRQGAVYFRFDWRQEAIPAKPEHIIQLLACIKDYINKEFEQEVLSV